MRCVRLYPLFAIALLVTATGASSTCVVQERVINLSPATIDSHGNMYALDRSDSGWGPLRKFDSSGLPVWVQPWPPTPLPQPPRPGGRSTLAVDRSGNVYVTVDGISEIVTVKHDAQGVRLWEARTIGDRDWTMGSGALMAIDDESGAVYVIGMRTLASQERSVLINGVAEVITEVTKAIVTIKYGPDGRQEWAAQYGSGTGASANAIAIGPDGSVAVAGCPGYENCVLLKYDAQGALLWAQPSPFSEFVRIDAGGAVYAGGSGPVRKYDASGALMWSGLAAAYGIDDMELDGAGNLYVGAGLDTAKYGPSGELLWSVRVPGNPGPGTGSQLALDGAGNVYASAYLFKWGCSGVAVGYSASSIATAKYDANGAQMWLMTYPEGEACLLPPAIVYDLVVDERGNVYVEYGSAYSGSGVIKYAQPGGP